MKLMVLMGNDVCIQEKHYKFLGVSIGKIFMLPYASRYLGHDITVIWYIAICYTIVIEKTEMMFL